MSRSKRSTPSILIQTHKAERPSTGELTQRHIKKGLWSFYIDVGFRNPAASQFA
jgi:hypothetical protein